MIRTLQKIMFRNIRRPLYLSFCSENKQKINQKIESEAQKGQGTQYTKWALARTCQSHNVQIMRRSQIKDRYSIHRLTNIDFMTNFITKPNDIVLTLNEMILFLAHYYHLIQFTGRDKQHYRFYMTILFSEIVQMTGHPDDLICMGTLMTCAVSLHYFNTPLWECFMDSILRRKYDQEFDQLFGMIVALEKYRKNLLSLNDFQQISKDSVISQIPIFYRKSLHVLKQFIAINIYNLKECRMLFESLYHLGINEGYFWDSVRDWFNIYIKEQIKKKQMDQFFIFKENAVDKVLFDHGMIRPRPILQELSSIVFILSQFGNISWRFIQFAHDLILYATQNGSKLFQRYIQIQAKQDEQQQARPQTQLNSHFRTINQDQKNRVKEMQRRYRTIFINPISLKSKNVIYLIVVFSRAYNLFNEFPDKMKQEKVTYFYDRKENIPLDPRIKKWLFMQLIKTQMKYNAKELIYLYRAADFFKEFNFDVITFIGDKLSNPRYTAATFAQIQQLLRILPINLYNRLNPILSDFLLAKHPSQIMTLTKKFQNQDLFPYLPQYLYYLPKIVNIHQKYYSFQQCCYFLYMIVKHEQIMKVINNEELRMKYENQFEQLKYSIKTATYNRGFKISINSYFHKILDYIDVVDFFQGGRA